MKPSVSPAPRLDELVNENGDIVYRPVYRNQVIVIYKADIERLLAGKPLNNTTIWEVIAASEAERNANSR